MENETSQVKVNELEMSNIQSNDKLTPNPRMVVTKMKCRSKLNAEKVTVDPYPMA